MITTCTECQARYQLDGEKIPRRKIRVRCPACSSVFGLDGTLAASASVDKLPAVKPKYQSSEPQVAADDDFVISNGFESPFSAAPGPDGPSAPSTNFQVAPEQEQAAVAVLEPATSAAPRRRRGKEEMLARALVSDILVYNRERRDTALAEGKLLEVLGGEIKKSWELYKEKVTPEVANSTNHFREALNEILADGQKVF